MNRTDLQSLAEDRLKDAGVLLANGRFGAAYYLAGYAVECALKACIAKLTKAEDFPIKNSTSAVYIHDLKKLAATARVEVAIAQLSNANQSFKNNWEIVNWWSEESRYDRSVDQPLAELMLNAVSDPQNGVLQCIRQYW
ncbi:MAG: HEPN domain-containing protein [Terriglobia bacterium]